MDGCALTSLIPNAAQIGTVIAVLYAAAKAVTILVPTPPPASRWGRVYHLIEIFALVVGHAKETGVLPATPSLDKSVEDAIALVQGRLT